MLKSSPTLFRQIFHSLLLALVIGIGVSALRPAAAAGQEIPGYVVVPLVLMADMNQATVRVSLNGKSTRLLLDTGASVTVLDQRFYKGARTSAANVKTQDLPSESQLEVKVNDQAADIGYIDSLTIGSTEFGKRPVLVTNLSTAFDRYNARYPSASVAGILGEEFLRKHAAIIDWARRGVYLNINPAKRMKLGPGLTAAGWTAVRMSPTDGNHFTVPAMVEGKPVRLIVDTGAQFTTFAPGVVALSMLYNRDNRNSIGHLASNAMTMTMIGGDLAMYPARVQRWKIGSYEIASSIVAVHPLPKRMLAQQSAGEGPILGVLGCEVLAKNKAIIDLSGSTLYLKSK